MKCWRCSSDAKNGEFCHDPFSPDKISEARLKYNFVECKDPADFDKVAVCKKLVSNSEYFNLVNIHLFFYRILMNFSSRQGRGEKDMCHRSEK